MPPTNRIARIVLVALLCAAAPAARAGAGPIAIRLDAPHIRADSLGAAWTISALFDDDTRRSLERGVGAELVVTIELWRQRRFWFGSLAATRTLEYSAWLDEQNQRYELHERGDGACRAFASIDELERFVCSPAAATVAAVANLDPRARYALTLTVEMRPLTLEAMRSIEWWMEGDSSREGSLPGSGITRRITSIAADLSGFGKRSASARSDAFRIGEIAPAPTRESGAPPAAIPPVGEGREPGAGEDREERHDRNPVAHRSP